MDKHVLESIVAQIRSMIGATMRGSQNPIGKREGLSFWFENYNRSNGPVFTIRPSGLKRHTVSLKFGTYAAPCIEHIQRRATAEDYALAYAFTEHLKNAFDLSVNDTGAVSEWQVSADLRISVTRKVSSQQCLDDIYESINSMMIPLVAAMAELIGYEDENEVADETYGDIEGSSAISFIRKRERSRRNRLLCLSIHGEKCGVCGFVTEDTYGEGMASILEVHHIEPLADIEEPKAYDPRTDLIPLCPNCHRAIHKRTPAFTPDELKGLMNL